MNIAGIFIVWQLVLLLAIMICLTSFKGEVNRHDISNIFLPIGPEVERLDRNIKLVKAIRWIFTVYAVGMIVFALLVWAIS